MVTTLFLIAGTFTPTYNVNTDDPNGSNGVVGQQWQGLHPRTALLKKFFPNSVAPEVPSYEMTKKANDDRAIFWGKDRPYEILDITLGQVWLWCMLSLSTTTVMALVMSDPSFPRYGLAFHACS